MGRTSWKTVEGPARIEYEVKKSVFIADVAPVTSGEEATDFIRRIKKEFPDARHHVYAYRTGDEVVEQRYSDDGEPSGTAGRPILGQIDSAGLSDILIVVVRYFGGILLGASGLANAYKTAARDAIDHATIVERTIDVRYRLLFEYAAMNDVMRILKDYDLKPENALYNLDCQLEVSVRQSLSVRLYDALADLRCVRIETL